MRLLMTLLVRDEEDVLEDNLDFHRSRGVDFFIVTDNLSVDRTPAILESYRRKGLVQVIKEPTDDYSQYVWVTRMAQIAATDHLADWVINNDADEFWWPENSKNLKDQLAKVPDDTLAITVERENFCALEAIDDTMHFAKHMVWRDTKSVNALGQPLPAKVCHRALPNIIVAQGNHCVSLDGVPISAPMDKSISIFHFPARSYKQFANKINLGGAAYARNVVLEGNVGATWRYLFDELNSGRLKDHYLATHATPSGVDGTARYVRDERLWQALCTLRTGETQ